VVILTVSDRASALGVVDHEFRIVEAGPVHPVAVPVDHLPDHAVGGDDSPDVQAVPMPRNAHAVDHRSRALQRGDRRANSLVHSRLRQAGDGESLLHYADPDAVDTSI
jgi:hypothetical protein